MGSPEGIEIVDVATGKEISRLNTTQPEQSAFSPDGKWLAFGNTKEKAVSLWNFADPVSVTTVTLPAGPSSLAWSTDAQKLAVGCADYSIQIFRTNDWQNIGSLQGHRQTVSKIAFNHRGDMLVSNAWDRTLRLWNLLTMTQLVELTGYRSESTIGFSADDRTIGTTDYKTSLAIVELVGLRRVCTAIAPPAAKEELGAGSTIDYSPDSRLLAKASTTCVQVFDAKKCQLLSTIPFSTPTQTTLRFLADGQTLAVLSRRTGVTLHRFTYQGGKLQLTTSANQSLYRTYAFGSAPYDRSPFLCLTSEKEAKGMVWDITTGQTLCSVGDSPDIIDIAISPDKKRLATAYRNSPVKITAFPSGQKVAELSGGLNGNVAFSPSGRWLGVTGNAEQLLWNTETWTKGPALPPQVEEKTGAMAFSYDEQYLAAMMRDQTALVSLPAGELLAVLDQRIQPNLYSRLRFSPDGSQLASQGLDNTLILWDLDQLQKELRDLNLQW
jgi:WD40 repeat protein